MKRMLLLLAAASGGSAAIAGATIAGSDRDAARFERLLAGKTAGKPVSCIDQRPSSGQVSAYGDKLAYRMSNRLVWVSDTAGGCGGVARGDILVTRQYQARLCRGDIAQTFQPQSRVPTGSCALGDFTPYRAP